MASEAHDLDSVGIVLGKPPSSDGLVKRLAAARQRRAGGRWPGKQPGAALVVLGVLGGVGGRLGGATPWRGAGRVLVEGGLAMAATAVIGRLVGAAGL